MAIRQVVPISIFLKSDGTSTVFDFSLGELYQISTNGTAVPYGNLGVVPTGVEARNSEPPEFINLVQSTTIDASGNITVTLSQPILPVDQIVNYFLNLFFDSGDVSSFPSSIPVTIVNSSVTVSSTQLPAALDGSGFLMVHEQGTVPVTGLFFQATQPVSIASTVVVAGNLSHDIAAPTGNNVGVLPAVASAADPTYIEGKQVLLSTDLTGALRVNVGSVVASNDITEWAGIILGSPSNYGVSPGGVKVIGVNAFVTNTVPVTLASTTITGTVAVTQSTSPWVVSNSGTFAVQASITTLGQQLAAASVPVVLTASQLSTLTPLSTVSVTQGTSPWVVSLTSTTITGSVAVTGTFFQAIQPVSGTVTANQGTSPWVVSFSAPQHVINDASAAVIGHVITDSGSTTVVTGTVAVTGTFFQAVQPVSGTVTANQGTSPWVVSLASTTITGTVAVTQSTSPWVVSGTVTANIGTTNGLALDATVAALQVAQGSTTSGEKGGLVMGAVTTAAPAYTTAQTSPLSLTLAGALRVDGSGVTQPISGAISFTAPQHVINDASAAVIGHVISDSGSTTVVTGNVTVVQPTGSNLHAVLDPAAAASSATVGSVSLGQSTGKTNVLKTGTLTSTAVTADQVVLTYTVTAAKTFYVEYLHLAPRLTTPPGNSNPVNIGFMSLESPAGTKLITTSFVGALAEHDSIHFSEPIPIAAGTVIRVVCTPDAATSTQWVANFGGYEK